MKFEHLLEGSKFITAPLEKSTASDNNRPYLLCIKLQKSRGKRGENAVRISNGQLIHMEDNHEVEPVRIDG
jgi:hypothetical protein